MELEQMMTCLPTEMMAILEAGHEEMVAKMDSRRMEA
jgi:hypothetical protein